MELKKLKMFNDKKGMTLGDIYPAVLTIVLIGVILGIGLYVLSQVESQISNNDAGTAVNTTISGLGDFADWIGIIVVVIAAAVIIGLVVRSFGMGGGRGV